MTTEQPTTESMNRVIAEFMGGKPDIINHARDRMRFEYPINGQYSFTKKELKYNSDHNWLISVVEKAEVMDYGFKMCRKRVDVYIDSTKETIINVKLNSRIESLHRAVYEFILWYNKHK